ncbi:SDR family NAD(P)-dependent oxidoreductase [Alteribacillus sp. JSM 102045]|uniref:SDR family NAD(P)-dependent oxidoreductase n=1 Tax=Alteribacillus sp. JSM 102045 TaxID=1562101 RepID=UPI0035C0F6FD
MAVKGKVIVITGASSGIGAALAKKAAEKGHYPVLIARSKNKLENLKEEIENKGKSCSIYQIDVTNEQEVNQFVIFLHELFSKVDVLINNAGVGRFALTEDLTVEKTKEMLEVNVLSVFYLVKAVLPAMKKNRSGHIINIGSQAGRLATPRSSIYAASKHALIGFSNALRLETEPYHIYVSTVNPGPVRTPFFQKADPSGNYEKAVEKLFIEPDDLAKKVMHIIEKPKRELNTPWWMACLSKLHGLFPSLIERAGKKQFQKK